MTSMILRNPANFGKNPRAPSGLDERGFSVGNTPLQASPEARRLAGISCGGFPLFFALNRLLKGSSLNSSTRLLEFDNFDLSTALKDDNRARVEVEDLGLSLEDEGIEFEDEDEDSTLPYATSSPSVTVLEISTSPSNFTTDSHFNLSSNSLRESSKRAKKVAAARRKRIGYFQDPQYCLWPESTPCIIPPPTPYLIPSIR
ncbi:hypothetical protein F5051DRAFT_436422 [Lentinula edodes]|nr:hypothetical protein F5051DRAFT_436422 [Lentinula edodes]